MQLNISSFSKFFNQVLQEDLGINGDITSNSIISEDSLSDFKIIAKQNLIVCGLDILKWYCDSFEIKNIELNSRDRDEIEKGQIIATGFGNTKTILALERVMLNFMQHLSGVATHTARFVKSIHGTKAKISDTRKTIPGIRSLQKYAVRCGGGVNHRLCLDSAIMIKDNHIAAAGSLTKAFMAAMNQKPHYSSIIVECDTLDQFKEALDIGAEIILLDNMNPSKIEECVKINSNHNNKRAILEASGGINL
ncbi:MAG: carboxylating nicotinate-nucleotide diphosphorylase, partial [Alphaproteobacteria bacterium]|nr:carboxylating nicotinate-nucleotide diphosphorylase [Alphaproteobacteria bacterium]